TCTVICRQLLITAVYASMDHCAQSQTIPAIIVNIGLPPTGGLSLFNLYVILSHS
ncbi:hypothetical protein PAXRUDRAFT_142105, partial [Paxillus rubicundulus Ve08.2h10]